MLILVVRKTQYLCDLFNEKTAVDNFITISEPLRYQEKNIYEGNRYNLVSPNKNFFDQVSPISNEKVSIVIRISLLHQFSL